MWEFGDRTWGQGRTHFALKPFTTGGLWQISPKAALHNPNNKFDLRQKGLSWRGETFGGATRRSFTHSALFCRRIIQYRYLLNGGCAHWGLCAPTELLTAGRREVRGRGKGEGSGSGSPNREAITSLTAVASVHHPLSVSYLQSPSYV